MAFSFIQRARTWARSSAILLMLLCTSFPPEVSNTCPINNHHCGLSIHPEIFQDNSKCQDFCHNNNTESAFAMPLRMPTESGSLALCRNEQDLSVLDKDNTLSNPDAVN